MTHRIVVAGATGDLGGRIMKALTARGATVIALVREGTKEEKVTKVEATGASVTLLDTWSKGRLAAACEGADCVVSALAGLRDVIVDAQSALLEGAIQAGVPRFIPSDFSTDYTKLEPGQNRNFDLRREFHKVLDVAPIASTAVYNGAFAEILRYNIPVFDAKKKTIGYWGDPDHQLDFTTMDDTAAYTAEVALDPTSPRALRIASFHVSANDLVRFTSEVLKTPFSLVEMGTVDELRAHNERERAANPDGENELYCRWQQGQYMQSMFSTSHEILDNGRYSDLTWTTLEEALVPRG